MAGNRKPLNFTYPSDTRVSRGEPPDKKRRTDTPPPVGANMGDDLWDDDLDLMTQDQFENIDFEIMSQQPSHDQSKPAAATQFKSSRMVGHGTERSFSEGNLRSISARSNTGKNGGGQGTRLIASKTDNSTADAPLAISNLNLMSTAPPYKVSTVTADGGNVHSRSVDGTFAASLANRQPAQLADGKVNQHYQRQSSSSRLCPPPKAPGLAPSSVKNQPSQLMGATGSCNQFSPALPNSAVVAPSRTDFVDLTQQKILMLEKELKEVKKEKEKVKQLSCQKEGEAHMLRGVLQETKQELLNCRSEQVKMRDLHRSEQSQRELELLKDVERVKTQMQFAERDRDELHTRCKLLERRCSAGPGAEGAGLPVVGVPVHSPHRRASPGSKSPSTPKGGSFPNRVSFMAEEMSRAKSSPKTNPPISTEAAAARPEVSKPLKPKWRKGMLVDIPNSRGWISGPALVSLLLPRVGDSTASEQGIVGLLQSPHSQKGTPNVASGDDFEATVRKTNRWIQILHQDSPSSQDSDPSDAPSLDVPHNYHALGVQAISNLLQVEQSSPQPPTGALLQGCTEDAVLLLPIIETYLSQYPQPSAAATSASGAATASSASVGTGGTSFTGSLDSYDSATSHQRSLARESARYARQVEQWALNALHILCVLVDFSPGVLRALFGGVPSAEHAHGQPTSPTEGGSTGEQEPSPSMKVSSDESVNSTVSMAASETGADRIARSCHILDELMRIANPEKISSTDIIEVSLQILSKLASYTPTSNLTRFESFLGQDVLQMCLIWDLAGPPEQRLRCHLYVLEIVRALSRAEEMMSKLCSASEDCLLLTIYTCVTLPHGSGLEYRTKFGLKLIQMLSSFISHHPSGMTALLEADCQCGCEVVKTVTQLLYHGLHDHRAAPSVAGVDLLQQGAVLLSTLAQSGRPFTQQRREIENQYIEVVIGLHVVFKESPDMHEHDEVIQTLWDFDVEYSYDADESDDAMETT